MASTIAIAYNSRINAVETFTGALIDTTDNTVTVDGADTYGTFNSGTTPAVSKQAANTVPMVSGALTLDLTSLTGITGDETVSGSGLRVQFIKLIAPATNSADITIAKGASNGYAAFGSSFSLTLTPGGEALIKTYGRGSVIGSGNKNLDISGTGTDSLTYHVVFG